jgi:photosystem II stability/assembly factor-like uncharacterized protein
MLTKQIEKSLLLLLVILLTYTIALCQWSVVKSVPARSFTQINVDVPPSREKRPPVILSGQFIDDRTGWVASDDGSLIHTSDGGKTWVVQMIQPGVNLGATFFVNNIGIFFTSKRIGWLIADYRDSATILRSNTGGRTWTPVFRPKYKSSAFHNIWFLDERRGWVVGEYSDNGKSGGFILATNDAGVTWKAQYEGNGNESFLHDIRFTDAQNGWAIGDDAILRTIDGGKNWRRQELPVSSDLFGIDVIDSANVWIVGSAGSVFHSSDKSGTWRQLPLPAEFGDPWLNSVKFVSRDRGWIAGNNGVIIMTTDGGKNWKKDSSDLSSYLRGFLTTKDHIFSFGNEGIILRRNL